MADRVAIVVRVSTTEQASGDKASIEDQLNAARTFAAAQGFEVVEEVREEGVSGAKELAERPGITRVLGLAETGDIDGVVWHKWDRASRSARTALDLFHRFESLGLRVYSASEDIDSSTPAGRLFRNMLLNMAEFERERILERTRGGMLAKASRGLWPQGKPPTGYKVEEGRLVPHETEAAFVQRAVELRAAGLGHSAIADKLNAEGFLRTRVKTNPRFTRKAVEGLLAHLSAYRGDGVRRHLNGASFTFDAPALVEASVADRAAAQEARKVPMASLRTKRTYGLRLRVFHDHEDGEVFVTHGIRPKRKPRPDGLVYRYYRCVSANTQRNSGTAPACVGFGMASNGQPRTTVSADRVEALVLFEVARFVTDGDKLAGYARTALDTLAASAPDQTEDDLEADLAAVAERRARLTDAYVEGLLDKADYQARAAKLDGEEEDLRDKLAATRARTFRVRTFEDLLAVAVEGERQRVLVPPPHSHPPTRPHPNPRSGDPEMGAAASGATAPDLHITPAGPTLLRQAAVLHLATRLRRQTLDEDSSAVIRCTRKTLELGRMSRPMGSRVGDVRRREKGRPVGRPFVFYSGLGYLPRPASSGLPASSGRPTSSGRPPSSRSSRSSRSSPSASLGLTGFSPHSASLSASSYSSSSIRVSSLDCCSA
jgi:site-specific DNA recombinase